MQTIENTVGEDFRKKGCAKGSGGEDRRRGKGNVVSEERISVRKRNDRDEGEEGRRGKKNEEVAKNEKNKRRRKAERRERGRRDEKHKEMKKK
ncbi:hypothetical protein RF55_11680, partial [Lasius niger]